jgi:hypothetical protein
MMWSLSVAGRPGLQRRAGWRNSASAMSLCWNANGKLAAFHGIAGIGDLVGEVTIAYGPGRDLPKLCELQSMGLRCAPAQRFWR